MNILLRIGGIRFRIDSDTEISIEESYAPFFYPDTEVSDVNIRFIHDFAGAPRPSGPMIGEDLLMEYYRQDGTLLCLTKGGEGRHLSCCVCPGEGRELTCWLNFPAGSSVDTLSNLLRMVPLRRVLLNRGVLFFHASQIAVQNTGILFTAPSQTGKTTQSKLWHRYRGSRILCNDRTLTNLSRTYGFPMDGSEPVGSGEVCTLGALVVLEQAPVNTVRRLPPREALPRLMPQLVLDVWDPDARTAAAERLLELIVRIPVYLLRCTPDEAAVECLEQQLRKDGVITNE